MLACEMFSSGFRLWLRNVIYSITCTLCNNIHIGEKGRKRTDRFLKHVREVGKKTRNQLRAISTSRTTLPISQHDNQRYLPTPRKGDKNLSQKFVFQLGTLNPHDRGLMNASNGANLVMVSYHHFFTDDMTNPL